MAWMRSRPPSELYLSVGVIAELWDGVGRLPSGRRRSGLEAWVSDRLTPSFQGRIEPISLDIAEAWGRASATLKAAGRNDIAVDALIGATAQVRGHIVVTRNVRDFAPLGVPVMDPWAYGGD